MLAHLSAVTDCPEPAFLITRAGSDQEPLCIFGLFRGDVDDTIYRIGAPERGAGPANHLNAINIFQRQILDIPIDSRKERRIHAPSVNQDKELVGKFVIETART